MLQVGMRVSAYCALLALLAAFWLRRDQVVNLVGAASPSLLGGSLLLLVIVYIADAAGWILILHRLGERRLAFWPGCWLWMASSISRYLPGGFWPYASRVSMARGAGVKTGVAALSVVVETLLLAVSALVAGLPAVALPAGFPLSHQMAGIAILLGLGVLHPRIISAGSRLPGHLGRMLAEMRPIPYREVLGLLAYYLSFWALFGLAFMLLARSIAVNLSPLTAISSFALAFLAGFVAVFAPGGVGVREGALYLLLAPQIGSTAALTLSVGNRIWGMVGEVASLLITALLGRRGGERRGNA